MGFAVASLVSAGISAFTQYRAGQNQQVYANYSAQQQARQGQMALLSARAQAEAQKRMAEMNFALAANEAAARGKNAKVMEQNVAIQDAVARTNADKAAVDGAALLAKQRSQIAASGVIESSGTPMDILAETASNIQKEREESQWEQENTRRTLLNEAGLERFGGELALAGALSEKAAGLASAKLTLARGQMEQINGRRAANMTRFGGKIAARAATAEAIGTLLSGAVNAYGKGF